MIIIVCGLPGSGKTYFATRLSDRLGARYVGSDRTRTAMSTTGQYSRNDKLRIYKRMAEISAETLDRGENVVVDGTFYLKVTRDLFIDLAKLYHSPVWVIEVRATQEIIKKRLNKPREDSEADFAVYQKIKQQFEKIEVPHLTLKSGSNNIDLMLIQATNYINTHK